jgi:transposase
MSLQPNSDITIPEETRRVAHAALKKGNVYLSVREAFGALYTDDQFRDLYASCGQPGISAARLAMVTVMQFAENLSDRQAAEAVRTRIDWKYVLGLELDDSGFDMSVLSEFRDRLLKAGKEGLLFEHFLARCQEAGLVKGRGRQRTDATHVLCAVRQLNRLSCVGESLRRALEVIAVAAPHWLQEWVPAPWYERYQRPFEEYWLPTNRDERHALAEQIGADGYQLLARLEEAGLADSIRDLPAVRVLRQVWIQQFYVHVTDSETDSEEKVLWRDKSDLPPGAKLICTPFDVEARYACKRDSAWTGYKVHLSESCDDNAPHLITDVHTTAATTADSQALGDIHQHLAERHLLPNEHLLDNGYPSAAHYLSSHQDYGIKLVCPLSADTSWQAKAAQGFAASDFTIDWSAQQVRCPQGHDSIAWRESSDRHQQPVIRVSFSSAQCQSCPARECCTRTRSGGRQLTLRPQAQHQLLQRLREEQDHDDFKKRYAARAGVEGTLSQGVRLSNLRQCRYIGFAKTHLQHLITGAAINLVRLGTWLMETPLAKTRQFTFPSLAASPAG